MVETILTIPSEYHDSGAEIDVKVFDTGDVWFETEDFYAQGKELSISYNELLDHEWGSVCLRNETYISTALNVDAHVARRIEVEAGRQGILQSTTDYRD